MKRKALWKKNRINVVISMLIAIAVLLTDIFSRPYFAVGGGGAVFVLTIIFWVVFFMEAGKYDKK